MCHDTTTAIPSIPSIPFHIYRVSYSIPYPYGIPYMAFHSRKFHTAATAEPLGTPGVSHLSQMCLAPQLGNDQTILVLFFDLDALLMQVQLT